MNEDAPIIFVCSTRKRTTLDWSLAEPKLSVLYTTLPDLVLASVRRTNGPGAAEVNAVIFDQSIGARGFLEFLSETSCEFRGDVLMIASDGSGVLSTVTSRDGRFIYQLSAEDIEFWAAARFGIPSHRAAAFHSGHQLARTA